MSNANIFVSFYSKEKPKKVEIFYGHYKNSVELQQYWRKNGKTVNGLS